MEFESIWDLESAMKVLKSETVESELWAEAVEWLILYGPPEIKQMLLDASASATELSFPGLKPSHITADGEAVYDIESLAKSLGIEEDEVKKILEKKNADYLTSHDFNDPDSSTFH